eukprot:1161670-Pelagomonas_calceolata.AAC.11
MQQEEEKVGDQGWARGAVPDAAVLLQVLGCDGVEGKQRDRGGAVEAAAGSALAEKREVRKVEGYLAGGEERVVVQGGAGWVAAGKCAPAAVAEAMEDQGREGT